MCGFCGYIDLNNTKKNNPSIIKSMNDALNHRGPDGEGFYFANDFGLSLGHKRLSIIDLTDCGAQPFISHSGRYVIVFNGEIYNYQSIKSELKVPWKSSSDTEVLIESIEHNGIKKTLEKIEGMFAFALWDNQKKELTLCRDRVGEKPLYYGFNNNIFYFGSELKSFTKHPNFKKNINTNVLPQFFAHGYISTPYSIYEDIFKLCPGSYLLLKPI